MSDTYDSNIFGGSTGLSYEDLKRRRAIAQALAAKEHGYPKNIGEGIFSLGQSVGDILSERGLKQDELKQRVAEERLINTPPPVGYTPATTAPTAATSIALPAGPASRPPPPPAPELPPGPPVERIADIPTTPSPDMAAAIPPNLISGQDMTQEAPPLSGGFAPGSAPRDRVAKALMSASLSPQGTEPGPAPNSLPTGSFMAAPQVAPQMAAAGNPPIPTDIAPMPVQVTPPARGGMFNPSNVPIPNEAAPPIKNAEPKPTRPGVAGPTPAEEYLLRQKNNPNLSESTRAIFGARYETEQSFRKLKEQQQDTDFTYARAKADESEKERDKLLREQRVNNVDYLNKQLSAQKTMLDNAKTPFEIQQIKGNIEKTQSEIVRLGQQISAGEAPTTKEYQNNLLQWDAKTEGWKTLNPNVNTQNIKLTSEEHHALNYFMNSYVASGQLGDQKALVGLADSMKNKIPVFGNDWVAPEYRLIKSAADAWIMNTLRHQSGATIRPEETKDYYELYFPRFGDTEQDIAAKAIRRKTQEAALAAGLGPVKALADEFVQKRERQRVGDMTSTPHGTTQVDRESGKQRINIHGYWEEIP
jgi:hypothetical protein